MDYIRMTAPCGLDCFNCPLYLAKDNERLRNAVAKNMNIPVEKALCCGCRNEKGTISSVGMIGSCSVWRCIEAKGLAFCCDCSDFPCDNLQPYADKASVVPHNIKVFNLGLIKKMGLESWAHNKAKSVRDTYYKGQFKL